MKTIETDICAYNEPQIQDHRIVVTDVRLRTYFIAAVQIVRTAGV